MHSLFFGHLEDIQLPPLLSGPLSQERAFVFKSSRYCHFLTQCQLPVPLPWLILRSCRGGKSSLGSSMGDVPPQQHGASQWGWKAWAQSPWESKTKRKKDATKGRGGVLFFSETCCTVGLCLLFLAQIAVANYIAYQMWFVSLSKETTARTCFPCCLHPIMRSAQIRFLMLHRNKVATPRALFFL